MSTKYIVNNLSGQTINGEPILRPYKVYTALLTQSGGDDPQGFGEGTNLVIGVTYRISDTGGTGGDWTNVGAPNNNENTYFVATGITPNSWGDGGILAYNTGAPVITVLENTIGNVWFEWGSAPPPIGGYGQYLVKSNGLFTVNKTIVFCNAFIQSIVSTFVNSNIIDINDIIITTGNLSLANDILYNTPIEIRVYN